MSDYAAESGHERDQADSIEDAQDNNGGFQIEATFLIFHVSLPSR